MKPRHIVILTFLLAMVVAVAVIIAARQVERSASPSGAVATSGTAADLPFGARTFRAIAAEQMPMVVNMRTESRRQTRDLTELFGDGLLERFFGFPTARDGVLVTSVEQASAAARAGILAGDVILQVTRRPVTDAAAAAAALRRIAQGSTGFVLLWRNGQELFVALVPWPALDHARAQT